MQKIPIRKFSFKLLIFSIVIAVLAIGMQLIFPQYASPALPFIVIFFYIITLLSLYIVLRGNNYKEKTQFISSYLLSRLVKFFSCLLFLLIYILINREDKWRFAIAFIVIYFLYSVFEIVLLRGENEKQASGKEDKAEE